MKGPMKVSEAANDMLSDNYKMKQIVEELHVKLARYSERIQQLEKEGDASVRIVWAMTNTAGGEIRIPDATMAGIDERCELLTSYDLATRETVFNASKSEIRATKILPGSPN